MIEYLQQLIQILPGLIANGELLPALLLLGAGTSIFVIADSGAQSFRLLNAPFVILGYLAGAALTAAGLYLAYLAAAPLADILPETPAIPSS